jgi:hypothetical protein
MGREGWFFLSGMWTKKVEVVSPVAARLDFSPFPFQPFRLAPDSGLKKAAWISKRISKPSWLEVIFSQLFKGGVLCQLMP